MAAPRLRVGTSGYSYKEWKGRFYPEDLPAERMLEFYAERFTAVEINNTFYRLPAEGTLARWAGQVPAGFTFVLKASRRITHERRLRGADEALDYLLRTSAVLGDKMGPLLFQLPPFQKRDDERLESFLGLLPAGVRAAFELRHASWLVDPVYALLARHGAALCVADADDPELTARVATAPWGYLRLRREAYDDAELRGWAGWIAAQSWREAFVFFKHEDEATGPRLARRFADLYP